MNQLEEQALIIFLVFILCILFTKFVISKLLQKRKTPQVIKQDIPIEILLLVKSKINNIKLDDANDYYKLFQNPQLTVKAIIKCLKMETPSLLKMCSNLELDLFYSDMYNGLTFNKKTYRFEISIPPFLSTKDHDLFIANMICCYILNGHWLFKGYNLTDKQIELSNLFGAFLIEEINIEN